jgi:hypothetical protein
VSTAEDSYNIFRPNLEMDEDDLLRGLKNEFDADEEDDIDEDEEVKEERKVMRDAKNLNKKL